MEIERKYLITEIPFSLSDVKKDHIIQAYICTDPVIRLRKKNDDYILTVKSRGLLAREETELPLTPESFDHLMKKTEGICIKKTRCNIPLPCGSKELLIELDLFAGDYEGLRMAEVEFASVKESEEFTPPAWFGKEVTGDPRFYNSWLSSADKTQAEEIMQVYRSQKVPGTTQKVPGTIKKL